MRHDYRRIAQFILSEILIPQATKRLSNQMDKSRGDDFRLLGRAIGMAERSWETQFSAICSASSLRDFTRDCKETLENRIRSTYYELLTLKFQRQNDYAESKWNPVSFSMPDPLGPDDDILLGVAKQFNISMPSFS